MNRYSFVRINPASRGEFRVSGVQPYKKPDQSDG